jgi:maleamate amidohydrolase
VAELGSWRNLLPEDEREQFARGGFGRQVRPGTRPALVVVDMTRMMYDPAFSLAPAEGAKAVVERCADLVTFAREQGWPVFWARRGERTTPTHRGGLDWKWDASGYDPAADEFAEPLIPRDDEVVVYKAKPSVFFETPLRSQLTFLGIDTTVLCGMSTSGCVRATALDAFSCNYRVLVIEEACGDRSRFAHDANLLDIDMKLGSVVTIPDLQDLCTSPPTRRDA